MSQALPQILVTLKKGVSDAIQDLEQFQDEDSSKTFKNAIEELKSNAVFLGQIESWLDTMPPERLRDALRACVKTVRRSFVALLDSGKVQTLPGRGAEEDSLPIFLVETMERLGPSLFIREDRMQASIMIDRKERELWSQQKVEKFLQDEGIVHGVDHNAIKRIFDRGLFDRAVPIARGTLPVHGKNGYIRYSFDLSQISGRPKERESGGVDHKELNLFYFVSAGETLAERIPPDEGKPGSTIFGQEIPSEGGVSAELVAGENTAISDDGGRLVAQADGYVSMQGEVISVKPSMLISGDVSYKTGNISSRVGVTVQGNVLSGFRVYSKESVNVSGLVEAASVIAEGDIAVNGGVEGKNKGLLQAAGSVRVQFLNDVRVRCNGSMRTAGSIYHSQVASGDSVFAVGPRGHIVESIIRAENDVWAEEIGSQMGVKTVIELGVVTLGIPARIEELRRRSKELEEKWRRVNAAAERLTRLKKSRGELDPEREKALNRAVETAKKLRELLSSKRQEVKALQETYEAGMRKMRFVRARRQIWPGSVIRILEREHFIQEPTGPATVTLVEGQIKILPYSEVPNSQAASSAGPR